MNNYPTYDEIKLHLSNISKKINKTPIIQWRTSFKEKLFDDSVSIFLKLELLQITGSFKLRGALSLIESLSKKEKELGVVAASGGNHGIAVAYVSKLLNLKSKIILPKNICKYRLGLIEVLGSEIEFVDNISYILDKLEEVAKNENLTKIHPFNHPKITLGTATLGYEFLEEVPNLDLVFVPIGGGGLASGVSLAIKQKNPKCKIIGVEPRGANSMDLSFKSGKPQKLKEKPNTIADSLSSPESLSYSFSICKNYIDEIILVDDSDIIKAMKIMFADLKLVTEPASAICIAALKNINKNFLSNKRVGVIICGSNISQNRFFSMLNS